MLLGRCLVAVILLVVHAVDAMRAHDDDFAHGLRVAGAVGVPARLNLAFNVDVVALLVQLGPVGALGVELLRMPLG